MRPGHPLEGQQLEVFRTTHRNRILHLVLVLPDGSRTLIPAAWTDFSGGGSKQTPCRSLSSQTNPIVASCSDLLQARIVINALLNKLADAESTSQKSKEESNHGSTRIVREGEQYDQPDLESNGFESQKQGSGQSGKVTSQGGSGKSKAEQSKGGQV